MKKNKTIRSGARAGKSDTAYPDGACAAMPMSIKSPPLKITHQEFHEQITKEVNAVLAPLKSYKDFLDAKSNLSFIRTEINETESRLSRLRDSEAELERAVAQFAKTLKEESEAALR